MDCSLPGSSDHGNSQARIPEWTAISFSRGSSQPRDWIQVSFIAGDSLPLSFLERPPRDLGVPKESDGQGGLVCYDSWGRKELDTTEQLNWTELTESEAETLTLWPPNVKNWLLCKDPDAGKDWRREEKGMTENEMAEWHDRLNGHEFE